MEQTKEGTPDLNVIIEAIRSSSNKDANAYKITEYYCDLTNGKLDDDGIAIVISKILNIEKYLIEWVKKHPNNGTTIMQPTDIMQPEESALILINDLRSKGLIK